MNAPPARRPWGRRAAVVAAGAVILLLSAGLMGESLIRGRLVLDDFAYLADARSVASLRAHLLTPHNAHVVPLFRIWTHLVIRLAGSLANAPAAFTWAAFLALALVMIAAGWLVGRVTKSALFGLAAMAGLGLTTVMEPSATWFAASQALWTGLCVLLVLIGLEGWRERGGFLRLLLALVAALAAPAFWSGGYAAGPVGAAFLWAAGRRKAAILPLLASGAAAGLVLLFAGSRVFAAGNFHERTALSAFHPVAGLGYSIQATPEVLVFGNLGLDVETTLTQAAVYLGGIGLLWLRTRRGNRRPGRLEAAGLILVATGLWLAYAFRGYLPWSSLRSIGWYQALPQIGAVLFLAGWAGERLGPRALDRRGAVALAALAAALWLVHQPRARRHFEGGAPPPAVSERQIFNDPAFRHDRAVYFAKEDVGRQRRALARLDQVERIARRLGVGRRELREALGRAVVPGWPAAIRDRDAFDLLDLPESGGAALAEAERARLAALLAPEPQVRPAWLRPEDSWPPER